MTATITFIDPDFNDYDSYVGDNFSEHEFPDLFSASEYLNRMGFKQQGLSTSYESNQLKAIYTEQEGCCVAELVYDRKPGRVNEFTRPLTPQSLPVIPVTADDPVIDPTLPHDMADDFADLSAYEAADRAMSHHEWEDNGTSKQMELFPWWL